MNKKNFQLLCCGLLSAILLNACATIIGGDESTAEASGNRMGPATIASGDTALQNDKFSALTVLGQFNGNKLVIAHDLRIESNAYLTKVTVRGNTAIKGNLSCLKADFQNGIMVGGNITAQDSEFESGIRFNGRQLELTDSSKVYGAIINTNPTTPGLIIIDHSKVRGNIEFAAPNSQVILRNKGSFKGEIVNGVVRQE